MKRILFICILLITSLGNRVSAQAYTKIVLDSKSSFSAQVANFDGFVIAGNITSANKSMDTLMTMIRTQITYSQYYLNDATISKNATLRNAGLSKLTAKQTAQTNINVYKSDVTLNKAKIDTELSNFIAVMD